MCVSSGGGGPPKPTFFHTRLESSYCKQPTARLTLQHHSRRKLLLLLHLLLPTLERPSVVSLSPKVHEDGPGGDSATPRRGDGHESEQLRRHRHDEPPMHRVDDTRAKKKTDKPTRTRERERLLLPSQIQAPPKGEKESRGCCRLGDTVTITARNAVSKKKDRAPYTFASDVGGFGTLPLLRV